MLRKSIVIAIVLLITVSKASAHSDTILLIEENGDIKGLPKEYQPAKYDRSSQTLRVGKNSAHFPGCFIDQLFPLGEKHQISLLASWYHQRSTLPPYLNFRIHIPDRSYFLEILFELDTLRVIQSSIHDRLTDSKIVHYDVQLSESCAKQFHQNINSISTVNPNERER